MSHSSIVPPPGFDDLPTDAKVDYVNSLWERVFAKDIPDSPEWHRSLVRGEIEAQETTPDDSEDWGAARADIERRLQRGTR